MNRPKFVVEDEVASSFSRPPRFTCSAYFSVSSCSGETSFSGKSMKSSSTNAVAFDEGCLHCLYQQLKEDVKDDAQEAGDSCHIKQYIIRTTMSRLKSWNKLSERWSEGLHLTRRHPNDPQLNFFWKIFDTLMAFFETFQCPKLTVIDFLRFAYFFAVKYQPNVLERSPVYKRQWRAYMTQADFRKLLVMPYYVQNRGMEGNTFPFPVVWNMIKHGKQQLLSSLLRYGLILCWPTDLHCFGRAIEYLIEDRMEAEVAPHFSNDIKAKLYRDDPEPSSRLRILFRGVEILHIEMIERESIWEPRSSKTEEDASSSSSIYFQCLRKAFDAIPEPYISAQELKNILKAFCLEKEDETIEFCIESLVQEFKTMFPETPDTYFPRSLQHLSRCQVRENLRKTGALPYGVTLVGLPKLLQQYVLLEKSVNV